MQSVDIKEKFCDIFNFKTLEDFYVNFLVSAENKISIKIGTTVFSFVLFKKSRDGHFIN